MVDIGGAIGPLIGARQWTFAIMLVEAECGHGTDLHLLGQLLQLGRVDRPVVERGLQCGNDARSIGAFGEVFRDDDEAAIAGAVLEGGEFHFVSLF